MSVNRRQCSVARRKSSRVVSQAFQPDDFRLVKNVRLESLTYINLSASRL